VTARRLPRSLDDVRGLRAARWIRESTTEQYGNNGPDSQRRKIEAAIERNGLLDTGIAYEVAVSGSIAWRSPAMRQLVDDARAGRFDVLVVGYSDRWQRNLRRTLEVLEDELHPAGVAVLFADVRILSSDRSDWDELVAESAAAERYIRKLADRIVDGYAEKFARHADQAGNPGLGFRRRPDPPRLLEVDPATIDRAVDVFRRYALGNVSTADLAVQVGLGEEQVRKMLRNRLYNGWAVRHRGAEVRPTSWRNDPPVDDGLWERVQAVRAANTRGGGPRHVDEADPLLGLLWCVCGRRVRADGTMGEGARQRRARMHPQPCAEWGAQARYAAETWEAPIAAQVAGLRLEERTIAAVRRVLAAPAPIPMATSGARFRREMRELAEAHLAERVSDAAYLAQLGELRAQEAAAASEARPAVDPDAAIAWLRDLGALWARATPAEQAELVRSIYARVEVAGPRFVAVTLTPEAEAHGLAIALPESVRLRERPRQEPGLAYQPIRIPIVGRRAWIRAARSA
jgi:DNA invertase Pin-like site-specific DNA recombinase